MMYLDDILFSLYEIKEDAEFLNKNNKGEEIQDYTSRIAEHAKAVIGEIKSVMTLEDLRIKKAFNEIHNRENTGEEEEEV